MSLNTLWGYTCHTIPIPQMRKPRPTEVEDLARVLEPVGMAGSGFRPRLSGPRAQASTPSPGSHRGLIQCLHAVHEAHFPEAPPGATLGFAFFGEAARGVGKFLKQWKILLVEEPGAQRNAV